MTIANDAAAVTVEDLTEEQGRALFQRACERELGIPAEEFLAAHDASKYPEDWNRASIQALELLLPFVR